MIGLDFFLTEPDALVALHSWQEKGRLDLFLFEAASETFHSKYYRFVHGGTTHVIAGSANLTGGGMATNVELSIECRLPTDSPFGTECRAFESSLLTAPCCQRATLIEIELYRQRYAVWHAALAKAAKKALSRVQSVGAHNIVSSYLDEYRRDPKEKVDLARRRTNYVRASEILRIIGDSPRMGERRFRELYEELVGVAGKKGLWHSGGLFRQKNYVISEYGKTQRLIATVAARLDLAPARLFELGSAQRTEISGLGPNVMTEIFNALRPTHYPVLNKNPLAGLRELGFGEFPPPTSFTPDVYARHRSLDEVKNPGRL